MFFCTSSQLVPMSQESLLEDDMTRDGAQPNCHPKIKHYLEDHPS